MSAVVAGAMTAGIGAANIAATPDVDSGQSADVRLSYTTIPIIDFDQTVGPLRIWRQLAILAGTNPLSGGLEQHAGNTYDLPGLFTTVDSDTFWLLQAVPGANNIDFSSTSNQGQSGSWDLLGVLGSAAEDTSARDLHFMPLFGGAGGIGASLFGTLGQSTSERSLDFFDSGLDVVGKRTVGDFNADLAVLPWDGFKAVGEGTAIDANPDVDFKLGSLTGSAGGRGGLSGGAGLCLGSGQSSCGGNLAFGEFAAPIVGGIGTGGSQSNIASINFPEDNLSVATGNGHLLSVKGQLGGTVSLGGLTVGRPINIDFEFPRTSSMTALTNTRQSQTVKTSFIAVPGSNSSSQGAASTGRHAAKDAVNSAVSEVKSAVKTVKKAVSSVTNSKPRHAKSEADD